MLRLEDAESPFVNHDVESTDIHGGVIFGMVGVGRELWSFFAVIQAADDVEVVDVVPVGAPHSRHPGPRHDLFAGLLAGARPVGTDNTVPDAPPGAEIETGPVRVRKGEVYRVVVRAVIEDADYHDAVSSVRLQLRDGRSVGVAVPMVWCGSRSTFPDDPGLCPFGSRLLATTIDAANRQA